MRDNIRAFVAAAAESFRLQGPVYEFGSFIVPGQEAIGDLRPLFPNLRYVGCDMREGPGVDRIEDLGGLTFDDESASTIVCVETLEHCFEVRRAVDEMIRVLAPGGMIFLSTPFNFQLHDYPADYWRLTPACLERLLEPLGATIIGRQGVESFPHTVFAVGCKAPVPSDFTARADRFIARFNAWLKQAEADEPIAKKLKRWTLGRLRSKGERRREREHYHAEFFTSCRATTQTMLRSLVGLGRGNDE